MKEHLIRRRRRSRCRRLATVPTAFCVRRRGLRVNDRATPDVPLS
jgi:hypothetical protein